MCVVGRDPGCDIVLNDSKCSRRHAVVEDGPEGLVIRDSGSANGIYVNGRKVEKSALRPGDTVRLGEVKLRLLPEIGETVVMAPEGLDFDALGRRSRGARRFGPASRCPPPAPAVLTPAPAPPARAAPRPPAARPAPRAVPRAARGPPRDRPR